VNDGEVIYQIVMDLLNGAKGNLCFSEDPMVAEFIQQDLSLLSFMIVDDCHSEPFEISLSTSVEDIAEQWGLSINTWHLSKASPSGPIALCGSDFNLWTCPADSSIAFRPKTGPGDHMAYISEILWHQACMRCPLKLTDRYLG
jgi:hypothetical protein